VRLHAVQRTLLLSQIRSSLRLSVCLSVKRVYYGEMKDTFINKHRHMSFLLAPKLVTFNVLERRYGLL